MTSRSNGDPVFKGSAGKAGEIASAGSLLGQLQRGRGRGYLRALGAEPTSVHPLLVQCITRDYRHDTDVETRSDYYSRLCIHTQMDLTAIGAYLRTNPGDRLDTDALLAIATLGELAQSGCGSATAIVRDYVAYGRKWDVALSQLAEISGADATAGLADTICTRFQTGAQMEASSFYGLFGDSALNALWARWEDEHECIARLLAEAHREMDSWKANRETLEEPDYSALGVEELLTVTAGWNRRTIEKVVLARLRHADEQLYVAAFQTDNPFAWQIAFDSLTALKREHQFYNVVRDKLTSFVASEKIGEVRGPKLGALERILKQLPPAMTLSLAREWLASPVWQVQFIGRGILEEHATTEDIPRLRDFILAEINRPNPFETNEYGLCSALDTLMRLPGTGQLPEVEAAYSQSLYSFSRLRAARIMWADAPSWFSETYAYECLWDCEEETRALGCRSVSLALPDARERLQGILNDSFESDLVIEAARERLGVQLSPDDNSVGEQNLRRE